MYSIPLTVLRTGDLAQYTLYNRAYFAGLIFTDSTKIRPLKNFPLYGIVLCT